MKYQHYKGGIYEIICEAKLESNPSITMIIYQSANGLIWARPSEVFYELIEVDGQAVQRFVPLNPLNTELPLCKH